MSKRKDMTSPPAPPLKREGSHAPPSLLDEGSQTPPSLAGKGAGGLGPPDTLVLNALARLNEIGASIVRLSSGDPAGVEETLHLIVENAIKMIPGASAVIYTYNQVLGDFDPVSRAAAGEREIPAPGDAPRPVGMGMRAITQLRRVLSYEETDLEIHPTKLAAGARTVACLPLVVADQAVGALYVYLREDRRFSQLELLLLDNFVNQAAMAIYHAGQFTIVQHDLARKESELSRLRHAGLLISSRTGLAETLEVILQMAMEVTEAKYGIFRLVDRSGKYLITQAIAGVGLDRPATEALPINTTSVMGWAAKSRQTLLIHDVRTPPWSRIYYPLDHALEMRSELVVPLIGAGGRLEGVLNLESPLVGAFTEEDSHLLQSLATQAVIAIQEARLLDALQEMAERLLTQPCNQVLDHLVALTGDLLNTNASAIWTLDGDQLVLQAAGVGHTRGETLPLHGTLTGAAILGRAAVTSSDVRTDPRFGRRELAVAQGWRRALVVPILAGNAGEPIGAFSVYGTDADPGYFAASDWDKKVLSTLAHYAGLAVRSAAAQAALRAAQEQRMAAETFAAVGDIAANLLHHLNNKVGAIPVRIEGIEDKCQEALRADPYLASNLHEIERSAREAMDTVRQSLFHLQSTQLGPVSVAACVAEALSSSRIPPTVAVQVTGLAALPAVVASQRGLALVFVNLLENAVEAIKGDGATQPVGAIAISGSERRDWVEITVSDSGPGIPLALRERVFELRFSGRAAKTPGKLGFGLWWVRTLLIRLGGAIAVEENADGQTYFKLRLPCAGATS